MAIWLLLPPVDISIRSWQEVLRYYVDCFPFGDLFGDLFSYHEDKYTKTELVIFLRPVVVKDASLSGDLRDYRVYLPEP